MHAGSPVNFPPVDRADDDGLLMVGGRLEVDWLIEGYRRAIFAWPVVDRGREILAWFSPDPRGILELDQLRVSRRLRRRIRSQEFQVTCNRDFEGVVQGCAGPRRDQPFQDTWITSSMQSAFASLHQLGHAHSIEVWWDGKLAGGIYGVALGGLFAGESMFHRRRDASKVALAYLVRHLQARGYDLLDVQLASNHTQSMGATEISRREYVRRLQRALERPVTFGDRLEVDDKTFICDAE
jgi:leucyl/phenylalanyl-tRNA--protein transferase